MEQYERLWQYQQVDMELDQYEKEMRGNSNRKELLKHRDFLLEQQNVLKKIEADVEIPTPRCEDIRPRGRVDCREREASERKCDFDCMECSMTDEEVAQEAGRCLRCDHFGYGIFKGGRVEKW